MGPTVRGGGGPPEVLRPWAARRWPPDELGASGGPLFREADNVRASGAWPCARPGVGERYGGRALCSGRRRSVQRLAPPAHRACPRRSHVRPSRWSGLWLNQRHLPGRLSDGPVFSSLLFGLEKMPSFFARLRSPVHLAAARSPARSAVSAPWRSVRKNGTGALREMRVGRRGSAPAFSSVPPLDDVARRRASLFWYGFVNVSHRLSEGRTVLGGDLAS